MRRLRASFTYVNVVGTLALFLALGSGVVWAADKVTSKDLAKGAVKNKNLAKSAVKNKNLAKNAVNSAKLAKGAVKNADLADGSVNFAKLATPTSVVARSSVGPISANQHGSVAFSPPLAATPVPGQPLTLDFEARGTLAGTSAEKPCVVIPVPTVNGVPVAGGGSTELLLLVSPGVAVTSGFPNGVPVSALRVPLGLSQPGVPQTVGIFLGDLGSTSSCTSDSTIQVSAVITQEK